MKMHTENLDNTSPRTSTNFRSNEFEEIFNGNHPEETSDVENPYSEPIGIFESTSFIRSNTNDSENKNINETDYDDNNIRKVVELSLNLKKWALEKKIPHDHLNYLLSILNDFISDDYGVNLPKDSRTLLSTPRSVKVTPMGNGEFWYYGIANNLKVVFAEKSPPDVLNLIFNMDGMPPFNSSNIEMWPILFSIDGIKTISPMVAAIYSGYGKPPLESYLSSFVDELLVLMAEGFLWNNKKIEVRIKCIVCDSPARSFIKGIVLFIIFFYYKVVLN